MEKKVTQKPESKQKGDMHVVFIDDACYSGVQWSNRMTKLRHQQRMASSGVNIHVHSILTYFTSTCVNIMEMFTGGGWVFAKSRLETI